MDRPSIGGFSFFDLPLQDTVRDKTVLGQHVIDIINHVPSPDKTAIEAAINAGKWGPDMLPLPFCIKYDVEVKVITQLVLVPQANGNVSVLKHMHFPDVKLLVPRACQHSRGESSKGGFFMATLPDAVDRGFAFIEEEAGCLGNEWKRIPWPSG